MPENFVGHFCATCSWNFVTGQMPHPVCKIEKLRKFNFTQIFHCKTMLMYLKFVFYIKDMFFWGM